MSNIENEIVLSSLGHTWILDLDGSLVVHNGYKMDGHDTWLSGAKEFLMSIPENDMIVFLTSRTLECAKQTEDFLKENGIRYHHIIYGAPYGERILLNDRKPSGLQMGYAINKDRDDSLEIKIEIDETL